MHMMPRFLERETMPTKKRQLHKKRMRNTAQKKHTAKKAQGIVGTVVVDTHGARVCVNGQEFALLRRGMKRAMHGDKVAVRLIKQKNRKTAACLLKILERRVHSFEGIYHKNAQDVFIEPLDEHINEDFVVMQKGKELRALHLREGDIVKAHISEYPTHECLGCARVDRKVIAAKKADLGIERLIASKGFSREFSHDARVEALSLSVDVHKALKQEKRRVDLRDQLCVTIDPCDSRDFDDAIGMQRLDNGNYELAVHIADVSAYVHENDAIDLEAQKRMCSVYLADRVLPMLPNQLCNDVCSLRPEEDRLAMSVYIELSQEAEVQQERFYLSCIRSSARLRYEEVDAYLTTGTTDVFDADIQEMIRLLDTMAQKRRFLRKKRGSLTFEKAEPEVVLGNKGEVQDIRLHTTTRATSLVEEAMLLANEAVAKALSEHEIQTAYRIHEAPESEAVKSAARMLYETNLITKDQCDMLTTADTHTIQAVIEGACDEAAPFVNMILLRAMKKAIYAPTNKGHYALGAPAYCHFTSPIRRYPDIIVHRQLKKYLLENAADTIAPKRLAALCKKASEKERVALSAEYASQEIKMAQYYARRIGQTYQAHIVSCQEYGVYVELLDTHAQGLVHKKQLGNEYFTYDEKRMSLIGQTTGKIWHIGMQVKVRVQKVDVIKGYVDFSLA